ncbi:MAG: outer membrane lipoprotein chaperone LolA [Ostreibacterium sp.]
MVLAQSDITDFFNQLKTFSADFAQTVKQDGHVIQRSVGKVWLKKPLKFQWDYHSPDKMQLLSDGKLFYHYDVDLAQVTVKPVKEVAESALIMLLNDKNQLDQLFNIQPLTISSVKKGF